MESPHLLTLPQELRNEIFRHLVAVPDGFNRFGTSRVGYARSRIRWFVLTPQEVACLRAYLMLAMTCRQLRDESAQMLYELNGFKRFAALGIRELPDSFIQFVRKLGLYGFHNVHSGYMWLDDCDAVVRIHEERDRIVATSDSTCFRGCRAHGVLSHWDIATDELVLGAPTEGIRHGVLIKITWKDMIIDQGWVSKRST